MRAAICSMAVTGLLVSAAQPAFAGEYGARYQIVQTSSDHDRSRTAKIVMLDRRTGDLWTWSERDGTAYAGILAVNRPGSFARIIVVDR